MTAGEWQQDLTRRARKTGRELTGAERTAGDESGFSAPVSPSLQTPKLHSPPQLLSTSKVCLILLWRERGWRGAVAGRTISVVFYCFSLKR